MNAAPFSRWRAGVVCLLLAAAACGDDDDANLSALPCDIREAPCQRSVWNATAQVRQQRGAKIPKIRVITRAQFADETRSNSRQQTASWSSLVIEGALRLVAFLPANTSSHDAADEASIAGVAAYYHKGTKDVTIIDDAASEAVEGTYTLSHEFTHALQDQREDLDRLDAEGRSSDGRLAIDALVEGEAVAVSNTVLDFIAAGVPRDHSSFYDRLLANFLKQIASSPAPWTQATLTLPYPTGGRPLSAAFLQTGYGAIAERLQKHPLTYAGWVEGGDVNALPVPLQCSVADAPLGYKVVGNDRVGGAGLLAFYTRLGLSGEDAFQAARAWTNDAFTIYAPMDESKAPSAVLAWRIGLRSTDAVTQLATKIAASTLAVDVKQADREIYLTAATDRSVLTGWGARDACISPKSVTAADDTPTAPLLPRPDLLPVAAARALWP